MKNKILQHSLRKIKNSYKRFISLLCMSLLGVGFFAGIQATSPDMIKTLDQFYDKQNVYDIEIVSTLGLTDNDIDKLKEIDNLNRVIGTYTKDVFVKVDDQEYVVKLLSINNEINKPYLQEGRMPKKDNEIVIESEYLKYNELKIGDTIELSSDDLEIKEFKIVGTVISPLYFSTDRGSTTLGNGSVDYYAYVKENVIRQDIYTNIYVTVNGSKEKTTFKDDYNDLIDTAVKEIDGIKKEREEARYDELYGEIISLANKYGQVIDETEFTESTWYIFDRRDNTGYKDLTDASDNIKKLGTVFPLVFYVIAILISLISMKRMVDEDRTENGTLKALGFNNRQITNKYVIYSLLATITGGLIGMIICFNLIPRIIWDIYKMLFIVPDFVCEFNIKIGLIGLIICTFCITGTAVIVSIKNLKNVPATLMRPKAPKTGKKIILERIKFIWNRLNFSNKITIRNIFRYKGRVCATIIGIAGCTSLILSGFGLKDSLQDIADYQFNHVFHYDKLVSLKDHSDYLSIVDKLKQDKYVKDIVLVSMENISVSKGDEKQDVVLITPDSNEEFKKAISLNNIDNNKEIGIIDDGVVISEKTSRLLNAKVNDEIFILDSNNKKHKVTVKAVIENYVNQYIYLGKDLYSEIFKEYKTNTLLLNMNKLDETFDEDLIKNKNVISIINSQEIIDNVTDMMERLNSVVLVLIVAAALLAFVVLYNLSNINISERKREIATLKVLGFHHKEVDNYITKENIILTIIGISIGLYAGLYLCHFIISTCEPDYMMFVRHVNNISYIISACITTVFTILVNVITHFNLKRINMIESLKNVE